MRYYFDCKLGCTGKILSENSLEVISSDIGRRDKIRETQDRSVGSITLDLARCRR